MRKIQMNTTLYLYNKFKNILFANKHAKNSNEYDTLLA